MGQVMTGFHLICRCSFMYNHDHENEVSYFAKVNFRSQMHKFGIKTDDRRRHVYVIGKTGMGKTTLLENFMLSDIYAGHGCCYVDPHGDTAEKFLNYIPSWRLNDVVYFNPADLQYPVGFNILEAVNENQKHIVAGGLMAVFKKIWENMWSSRMEYILNNTILALLDNPGQTLLGINRMMSDEPFRKRMVGNIKDPVVKQFWVTEFASWTEKYATEATAAIQNKIGQFLSASVIRNIVAQVKSTINVREIMDQNKIFIVNLSKGRVGEDNSRLLGGLLITKIQLAAMERVDTPEHERDDFYLYVDEFQNFAVDSFASILSEARKYRLCLTMAHQYIAQLTEPVRDAVFGNVGTVITFRVGSPDAMFMETEFMPRFTPEDIINLPKYNVYVKLLIDGVTSQPFSAITLPPIAQVTHSTEKVIRVSRERYAQPREAIESKILEWSGMGSKTDEEMYAQAAEKKKAAKSGGGGKPKHHYNCTRCDTDITLPVELDRSRPIYCDDCITIIREEKKKGGRKKSGGSNGPKGGSEKGGRREDRPAKKAPVPAPKVGEGEVVEKASDAPSMSLSALKPVGESVAKQKSSKVAEGEKGEEVVELRSDGVVEEEIVESSPSTGSGANESSVRSSGEPRVEASKSAKETVVESPKSDADRGVRSDKGSDSGSAESAESAESSDAPKKKKRKRKKKKKSDGILHDYACSTCSTEFQHTIKFDSSKPILCESCLEKKRAAQRIERSGDSSPSTGSGANTDSIRPGGESKAERSESIESSVPVEPIPVVIAAEVAPKEDTGTLRSGQAVKFE